MNELSLQKHKGSMRDICLTTSERRFENSAC